MITKVKLANWRSHLNSELNFLTGTNALLGHMGAGKTSLLDSICFAFFGTTPTLQSKKLKLDDVIMKRPFEKDKAEVEVHFQLDGINYSIKRIIEKGKGTTYSEIRQNEKLLEAPSTQRVNEIVEKILKVNYDLFSKAIYSEQNALDYFLTIQKGQRMKKIDELLMIDKFEKARTGTVGLINKLAERKLGKQSVMEKADLENLQKNILELNNALNLIMNEKLDLQRNLAEVTTEKTKIEKEVSELQKIKQNLDLLKRDEKGITSAVQEAYSTIEKFEKDLKQLDVESVEKNLSGLSKIINELNDVIDEKSKRYQKLQGQTFKSKAEVEFLRKEKIEKIEKELNEKLRIKKELERLKKPLKSDIRHEIKEKRELVEKLIGEIESIKAKITNLKETLDQVSSLGGKCPICESRLTAAKKKILIKQKHSQIKALKESLEKIGKKKRLGEQELEELENIVEKLDRMSIEVEDFDRLKSELENSRDIYTVLNESAVKLESELLSLENELGDLQNKLKLATSQKQKLEIVSTQIREYVYKKDRINLLMQQRENLSKHVKELESSVAGKELGEQEKLFRNLIAKEQEIATKIVGLDQLIREKEIRLKDFEKILETISKEEGEVQKLEKLIQGLKIFEKALEQTQTELRKEFIASVNYTMNNLWQTLYPYQDFIGIRLSIEEGDYVLQLQERSGKFVNVEGMASGGERSIACLTLRIAFALVLAPQLRLLFLDEPTANLDKQAINELATTLRERIGEFINQTFLITHQDELEDSVTGSAYRFFRDKEVEGVTKIMEL